MSHFFFLSNFDDFFVDFDLPVGLQRVEVVVGHLVELGVGDVVQSLQDLTKAWTLFGVVAPAQLHLERIMSRY